MISLQPNADSILMCDVNRKQTEEQNRLDELARLNSRLTLAFQGLTEVPEKVLKKYSSCLVELDLSHNNVSYPWTLHSTTRTCTWLLATPPSVVVTHQRTHTSHSWRNLMMSWSIVCWVSFVLISMRNQFLVREHRLTEPVRRIPGVTQCKKLRRCNKHTCLSVVNDDMSVCSYSKILLMAVSPHFPLPWRVMD